MIPAAFFVTILVGVKMDLALPLWLYLAFDAGVGVELGVGAA